MEAGIASAAAVPQPLARAREGRRRYLAGVFALAALYYGAAHIGYALEVAGPVGAIVWLPVGVGVAFLYLGGLRFWPGVLVGDLLVNDYSALPLGTALGQTCGNVLEVLTVAFLMRRLTDAPLSSVRGLGRMLVAIVAGCVVSATIGTLCSLLGDVIAGSDVPKVWRTWWLGDACGALARVLSAAWRTVGRYHALVEISTRLGRASDHEMHAPVLSQLVPILERGRRDGSFDAELPVEWMLTVALEIVHAASRAVSSGHLDDEQAERLLVTTVLGALAQRA